MATKKKSPLKGRKHHHFKHITSHERRVNGLQPAIVNGMHHKKRRKKRKVSGLTGSDMGDVILGALAGAAANIGADMIAAKVPVITPMMTGMAKVVGGAIALVMSKGKGFGAGFGAVGIADGAKDLAKDFGIIQGITDFMSGAGDRGDAMVIEMNGGVNKGLESINTTNQRIEEGKQKQLGAFNPMPSFVSGY